MKYALRLGFTLAEVLITLSIIGVIAAMTLPALITKVDKSVYVTGLKKSYGVLSQGVYMIRAENGSVENALSGIATNDGFANVFIPKLNVAKNCGIAAGATGCYSSQNFIAINGSNTGVNLFNSAYSTAILTNDGITVGFTITDATCNSHLSDEPSNPAYNNCGFIAVDINGPNKGPNQWGRDIFRFHLTKKGLYPDGSEGYYECTTEGRGCAYKVLSDGAMNY